MTDPSWLPNCQPNDFLDSEFDFTEFNIALEGKNEKSACGMDGIDYEVLKKLPIKYKLILVDIFNEMYRTNSYPEDWKKSYVHFIAKSDGKSVRPISLTSCICKLFETMIKNKFQWWLEFNNLLPQSQTGFRKGHSTSDNLLNLTAYVDEALQMIKTCLPHF